MTTPPITPRHQSIKDFTLATPLTPRSSAANEIKARHHVAHNVTLSISHFTSLIAELIPSSPSPSLFSPPKTERTRLDRIEEFRQDFLCGAFMREKPPELVEDAFSDGARTSLGGQSTVTSSVGGGDDETNLPRSLIARGVLAERTIKSHLRRTGALLSHRNFKSLPAVARRAMAKTLAQSRPMFVSCGLLRAPNFSQEYEERGWAAPGIRWGNFKPDLVRFSGKGEGEVVWEVVEVKYSSTAKDVVYANYKVQAIYYHLALAKLLSAVPLLSPSHKVSLWLSHDPLSPTYLEKPLALRTTVAFGEHHLFVLLPQWLHIVTKAEWDVYEERRKRLAESSGPATPVGLKTPGLTFMDRLQASSTPAPGGSGARPSSPLKQQVLPLQDLVGLPPLPDESDDDLAELLGGLALSR